MSKITFRPRAEDRRRLAALAADMRATEGREFVTQSEALREAIRRATAGDTGPERGAETAQ